MDSKNISKNIIQLLTILLITILTISCDKSNEQAELFDLKIPLGLDTLTMFILAIKIKEVVGAEMELTMIVTE